jgi:ParB-like nuclease domain
MAQLDVESVGTMLIRGEEIPVVTKLLEQDQLRFYVDNPRVYSVLRSGGKDPSQEEIQERLQKLEHVKELREDIKANKGLLEPLIVKSGSFEVLEGNSRLAAYRALVAKEPLKWNLVKCTLLPADIPESLVFGLLGQYHLKGKKDWAPYEQAGFLYRRFHKHNADPHALAREIGMSVREVNRLIEVYSFMIQHGENDVDRWSYYDEYLRSNKIRKARVQHPELDSMIVDKIRSKEIAKAVDVRDQLPTICTSPKVLNKFVNETVTFDEAYESAVSAGGENGKLNQIKRFRETICKPETETRLLSSDMKAQKAAKYELRKIGDRIKHLLIKLGN